VADSGIIVGLAASVQLVVAAMGLVGRALAMPMKAMMVAVENFMIAERIGDKMYMLKERRVQKRM
jgi:hypothetical protein